MHVPVKRRSQHAGRFHGIYPLNKNSVPPLARPLNSAALRSAQSSHRVPLAGLRRGLARDTLCFCVLCRRDPVSSASIESFSQANEAQFYVSMSRAREAMHLFTDSKAALREAVTKPSSRVSPLELINSQLQSASRQIHNLARARREMNQAKEQEMER